MEKEDFRTKSRQHQPMTKSEIMGILNRVKGEELSVKQGFDLIWIKLQNKIEKEIQKIKKHN